MIELLYEQCSSSQCMEAGQITQRGHHGTQTVQPQQSENATVLFHNVEEIIVKEKVSNGKTVLQALVRHLCQTCC